MYYVFIVFVNIFIVIFVIIFVIIYIEVKEIKQKVVAKNNKDDNEEVF